MVQSDLFERNSGQPTMSMFNLLGVDGFTSYPNFITAGTHNLQNQPNQAYNIIKHRYIIKTC